MANGQLATKLDSDYEWDDRTESSSDMVLVDWWPALVRSVFGMSTPHVEETVTTENPQALEDQWQIVQFALEDNSLKKWRIRSAETGATSPFLPFLLRFGADYSFERLLAFERASAFKILLASVRRGLDRDNGDQLANRLEELRNDLAEEEDLPDLSMRSVLGLIRFLRDNPKLRDPGLVASDTGNIRAEWHKSWSQHFVVEFTSDTEARFVVFMPDVHAEGKVARISGICSASSLLKRAVPRGVKAWAMRT